MRVLAADGTRSARTPARGPFIGDARRTALPERLNHRVAMRSESASANPQ